MIVIPNEKDLAEIKNWLEEDRHESGYGYINNWEIIVKACKNNECVSYKVDKINVGFLVFTKNEYCVTLDIIAVSPKFRNQGIGKNFYHAFVKRMQSENIIAINGSCPDEESYRFFKQLGFVDFPKRGYSDPEHSIYKILIETLEPVKNSDAINRIELWDVEPHKARKNFPPRWVWELNELDQLPHPILLVVDPNWNMRLYRDGKLLKEHKVKYFGHEYYSLVMSVFLRINNISEIKF